MRFLFTTIQSFESDFYGSVGGELDRRGHEVAHLTVSRRSAARLQERGFTAACLRELVDALPRPIQVLQEERRIVEQYRLPSIRDVYRTDPPGERMAEQDAVQRTVQHFLAVERLFDDLSPDVLIPEVGTELIRIVAHEIALNRGIPTLFLFYTIFRDPLRLYVDTMHAPIVPPKALRPLEACERVEVDEFIREFTRRRTPIRRPREVAPNTRRVRQAAEYVSARVGVDRDNEYLTPGRWALEHVGGWGRALAANALYQAPRSSRPFVYFPLHVTDDYKIKRIIPHCADQISIAEQVADALPPTHDLVVKEHPLSIGRNPLGVLKRLRRRPNIRLVAPRTSTHELIERSDAVAVISSTVGLEALLYAKPVLTVGQPFYSGYGFTVDVDSFSEIPKKVPETLSFRPDPDRIGEFLYAAMQRCLPGAPVLVDRSNENARVLAASLERGARDALVDRRRTASIRAVPG
jgi:hypothetical protein